jgi:hypothetical protein
VNTLAEFVLYCYILKTRIESVKVAKTSFKEVPILALLLKLDARKHIRDSG